MVPTASVAVVSPLRSGSCGRELFGQPIRHVSRTHVRTINPWQEVDHFSILVMCSYLPSALEAESL